MRMDLEKSSCPIRSQVKNLDAYYRGSVGGILSPDTTADVMAQAARTLHDAHRLGWTHLDVKPTNFMRQAADPSTVFTIDWEMAMRTGARCPRAIGTVFYMAPEMAEVRPLADPSMDVYSLALTMGELQMGRHVRALPDNFKQMGHVKLAHQMANDRTRPHVPDRHFQAIIDRAMHPNPQSRGTALDVMADLAAYPSALARFDQDDLDQIAERLVKRGSNLHTRHIELDAAAAHGLLTVLDSNHPRRRSVEAFSQLGPPRVPMPSAPETVQPDQIDEERTRMGAEPPAAAEPTTTLKPPPDPVRTPPLRPRRYFCTSHVAVGF